MSNLIRSWLDRSVRTIALFLVGVTLFGTAAFGQSVLFYGPSVANSLAREAQIQFRGILTH